MRAPDVLISLRWNPSSMVVPAAVAGGTWRSLADRMAPTTTKRAQRDGPHLTVRPGLRDQLRSASAGLDDELGVAAGLAAKAFVRNDQGRTGRQQLGDAVDRLLRDRDAIKRLGGVRRRPWVVRGRPASALGVLLLRLLFFAWPRGVRRRQLRAWKSRSSACACRRPDLQRGEGVVPSGLPGLSISIGMSNSGTKAWRTKIRFSLPLMKTAT